MTAIFSPVFTRHIRTVLRSSRRLSRFPIRSNLILKSKFQCSTSTNVPDFSGVGRLNHLAIACSDLKATSALYRDVLKAQVSDPLDLPEHGVTTVFVNLGNTKLELLQPLGDTSPISAFLKKNPAGGMHHISIEVDDIQTAHEQLTQNKKRVLGDIKIGAHGEPVLFVHPKDMHGVLVELEQKKK